MNSEVQFYTTLMTRHTFDEYKATLHQHTGLLLDIRVYDNLQPETLGLWQQEVEIAQVADVADLSVLQAQLPKRLSRTQDDVQQRIQLIAALQKPCVFERALLASPHFSSLLCTDTSTLDTQLPPLAIIRKMRNRIARLVWEANPLLLMQLEQITQSDRSDQLA